MLRLPCEELLDIINDDALNTKTEVSIWEFCLKWIGFDEENRLKSMPLILRSIRLGLLDKDVNLEYFITIIHFIKRIKCVSGYLFFLCSISNSEW